MVGRRLVDISQIYTLVLDEADEMLKMGFINDIRKVMALTPKDKQIALFSATMPREIQNITWEFMSDAAEIDVMPKKTILISTSILLNVPKRISSQRS